MRGIAKVALFKREKSRHRRLGKLKRSSRMSGKAEEPEEMQPGEPTPEPVTVYTQLEVRKVENDPVIQDHPIIPHESYEYTFEEVDEEDLEEVEIEEFEEKTKKHCEFKIQKKNKR